MIHFNHINIKIFGLTILISFLLASSAISQQSDIPQLIQTSNLRLVQPLELAKSETFRSTINIDLTIFEQILDDEFKKFLIPGIQTATDTVTITRIMNHPTGYSIIGYLNGAIHNSFTLSFAEGRFLSQINRANTHSKQQIRYAKGIDSHILVDVNPKELDILLCQVDNHEHASQIGNSAFKQKQSIQKPDIIQSVSDIDVMITYTPAAVAWLDENDLELIPVINESMARAQLAFDNSEVQINLNLVHTLLVDYEETGSMNTDLENLSFGKIQNIIRLREIHGADLVAMFTKDDNSGGLAWYMNDRLGNKDYGFSITRIQQAWNTTTHAHEMGHNLGSAHSRNQTEQAASTGLLNVYSTGWRWMGPDSTVYVSVMTYAESGTPVDFFSNPDVLYMNVPTGSYTGEFAPADNARSLNGMRGVIGNYKTPGFFVDETLCESIGNCELTFKTDEKAPWLPQSQFVHSGSSSLQSFDISNSQSTGFETTITGPDTLSFYWKVSSEADYDLLEFAETVTEADSVITKIITAISGSVDWELVTHIVPAGSHTYRWSYAKDDTESTGLDLGWVDSIECRTCSTPTSIVEDDQSPNTIVLFQNYPNPFNPTTVIEYSLPQSSHVRLEVYSILGQLVATLVNERVTMGTHTVSFDGKNLSSGVYIYRLTTPEYAESRMMNLIK